MRSSFQKLHEMEVVADESIDFEIFEGVREKNINVYSIVEESPGIKDAEVLKVAYNTTMLLVTEDKDFGELAIRLKYSHRGILLIRLNELPRIERIQMAVNTIAQNIKLLRNNFAVLSKNGLRIKNMSGFG